MYRILIACEDERMATGIEQALDSNFAVECCGTAQWALELINSFMPDVVVVSNGLADMDAFSLVRAMRLSGEHFGIILLTDINNPVITMQVKALGVDSLFLKPCKPGYLAAHIQSMAFLLKDPSKQNFNIEEAVGILLSDFGFRMGPERYRCIRQAILAKYKGGDDMMMKNVYIEVARQKRGTPEQVEKAVRDAIKAAWQERDPRVWDVCFRPRWNKKASPPTNEEFIARIVEGLKQEQRFKTPVICEKIG